jgi:hypothetical protein
MLNWKRSSVMFSSLRAALLLSLVFIATPFYIAHSQTTSPAAASAQLELDRTIHNFGDVFTGEILSTSFRVRNLGTKALELSEHPILAPRRVAARESDGEMLALMAKASLSTPRRAAPS